MENNILIFLGIIILVIEIVLIIYSIIITERMTDCCSCPAVSCSKINNATRQVREALNTVLPEKWFLCEGTLISALRWGEHCHQFKSGKKNFVDGDTDVYIITEKNETPNIISSIGNILKKSGWSEPKDRGDGIFVSYSPVRYPTRSCKLDSPTKKFYVDIHVMHPVPGGFEVGKMKHLWKYFLQDGILPYDVIYPLAKCSWGGGLANAPAKYLETLAKWNGNEYGSSNTMWKPIERVLATGDWFNCECNLSTHDVAEIKESIQLLKNRGLAAFNIPKVVVSLTTIPPRLPKLEKVLLALSNQPEVDIVYLNLPYICDKTKTAYDPLPVFLHGIDKLKIQRCKDYGPLTKLLPTLETELDPSTIIIICDDDMLYEGNKWASGLANAVNSTTAASYNTWKDDELTILMGYTGFAFQRQVFTPGYLKFFLELPRSCKFGDDYSISYYLKQKGVKVVQIKENSGDIINLQHHGMPEFSLMQGVELTQGNDANYKQCKKYFESEKYKQEVNSIL